MQKILHTPEGVRDIYNKECEQKLLLQQQLHDTIKSFGYWDIETPTFEFSDVFSKEVGTISSRELYKFFDREGNTLVLRPDFTPSIARAASKFLLQGPTPVRLTYLGNTFINNSSYQGRMKENTQIGAELLGDDSADADAEMLALVIRALQGTGLKDFQVSIGHVGYFEGLAEQAGISDQQVQELKELISNKNTFGVEKLLADYEMEERLRTAFSALPRLFGQKDALDRAETLTNCSKAREAIARLRRIYEILEAYQVEQYVSFDFGMLSHYMYYTGVIFRAYTFGTGGAVVKGGRYDRLLAHFGQDTPAVGFVTQVNSLQNALTRQGILQPAAARRCMLLYEPDQLMEAIQQAEVLRNDGIQVEMIRITDAGTREYCRAQAEKIEGMQLRAVVQ